MKCSFVLPLILPTTSAKNIDSMLGCYRVIYLAWLWGALREEAEEQSKGKKVFPLLRWNVGRASATRVQVVESEKIRTNKKNGFLRRHTRVQAKLALDESFFYSIFAP